MIPRNFVTTDQTKPYPAEPRAVRHLGRVNFLPVGTDEHRYRTITSNPRSETLRLLIHFDGKDYPFLRHFVYARHKGEGAPYTFQNFEFQTNPPGVRVGPWPGWRGVPEFPSVTLDAHGDSIPVLLTPWGDELVACAMRGVATLDSLPPGELICTVSDNRLRPVYADLYSCPAKKAAPVAVDLLPELIGNHPRLLVTRKDIPELRERAHGSHRDPWGRILSLLEGPPLPWKVTPESKALPGPERLRGEDRALMSALVAMSDPSSSHCSRAREAVLEFHKETMQPGYQPLSIDTQSGETLFILATSLDWSHDLWSSQETDVIRSWLWKTADICWSHLGYERRDYAQAHYLGCALGLLAFSFLYWEEHPRAREWAEHCRGVLNRVIAMLPQDGYFPHGINLWIYEYGFLLRWLELFRVCAGIDLWHSTPHWRNASMFRGASTSHDGRYGITFGDPQYLVGGDSWCHYLIASRTRSPHAQHLGNLLLDGGYEGVDFRHVPPRRRVYEFLFFDPGIPPQPQEKNVQAFEDGGQVFVRHSGINKSLFTFRAGSPLGEQRYRTGEQGGYGHADPANGSFFVSLDDAKVVSGPGPTYRRDTSSHNTITIDGQGQVGDSTVWLPDFFPPEVLCPTARFRQHDQRISISAALAPSFLPHLGVEQCDRSLWIDPGRLIAGVDTVRCSGIHSVEWNIHSPSIVKANPDNGAMEFDLGANNTLCRLAILEPLSGNFKTGFAEMVPAYPNDGTRLQFLRVAIDAQMARFVWCVILDGARERPRLITEGDEFILRIGISIDLRLQSGFLVEAGE